MSTDPATLDALLESVADGAPVDWTAVESSADDRERRLVGHLRLVAGIAEVHRTVPAAAFAPVAPAPLTDFPTGHAIPRWGHLLLLEKVGEGAFGDVYRARDPWLDREVALKLLKPPAAGASPARIITEARALARVRHPNVVTVHGADVHDGRAGLWMEFVRGSTLGRIVATQGPFSAAEAALAGSELCRALGAVHAAGLVHRDIKAQNVMREAGGRLVLMDFGAGHTPLYLAPELLAGGEPSIASDIYAGGVLLYYLVTGSYPVRGDSLGDILLAHTRGERRHLGDARPDLPDDFVGVVERALREEPSQRYPTAREMQEALAPTTSLRVPAQHPAPDRQLRAPLTRYRRPAVAAATIVLAGIAVIAALLGRRDAPAPLAPVADSVAVLPFRPIGSDPETVIYSEGLSEDLTGQLARLASVRVVSGVSVRRYRGTDRPAHEIGQELQVAALVSGSVRLSGGRLRVVVELVDSARATQLWARVFERPRRDVATMQTEVIHEVARALVGRLRAQDAERLGRRQPDSSAFDLYLKGRYYWNTRTPGGIRRAIDFFKQSIAADPQAALPHAGLADAYMLAAFYNVLRPAAAHAEAERAAARAVELDPELAQAHAAIGALRLDQFRWREAEVSLQRAIELNASYAQAHHWLAIWLAEHGRFDDAFSTIRRARTLDPFSSVFGGANAYFLYANRRYDDALAEYRQVLDIEPSNFQCHLGVIETHAARGALADATRAIAEARRRTGRPDDLRLAEAYVYALARNSRQARRALSRVVADLPQKPASPAEIASVHAALGDLTQAFAWLERAVQEGDTLLGYLGIDPRFDRLRADPRFAGVLARIGLPAVERNDQ